MTSYDPPKMNIDEVKVTRVRRVDAHSHVKGLGLDEFGDAIESNSIIGQDNAREVAGMIVTLIKMRKYAGKATLIAGPPGVGKTALAMAIAKELGTGVPFVKMVGSEVYSSEVKKTEILTENFRKSIMVRFKETKEVYEGEVTEITPVETENPFGTLGKTLSHVLIGLKASKGTRELKLDPSIYDTLQKERVEVGDVIYIECNTGFVKRLGRSDSYATEYDLETEEYVPIPKGEVHSKKPIIQDVTLNDLDTANARPKGGKGDILSMVTSMTKHRRTEITEKLRNEINNSVHRYVNQGVAELIPGVLFIDECHMMDMECFTFLHRLLENPNSPILILATNRAEAKVLGSDTIATHGIPADLLDRLTIIKMDPYNETELKKIISIRAAVEGVKLTPEALNELGTIGLEISLRYAMQLMSPANQLARVFKKDCVDEAIIRETKEILYDTHTSAKILTERESTFLH